MPNDLTQNGWTHYKICVTNFDFLSDPVQYDEYTIYDYDLNREQLAALDDILSHTPNDTSPEVYP